MNPRIQAFDIKYFTELRPGLIGWFLLNICMALKQYSTLERVTNSMILVVLFQGFYILDALWNEASILSTMDITTGKEELDGRAMALADILSARWIRVYASVWELLLGAYDVQLTS